MPDDSSFIVQQVFCCLLASRSANYASKKPADSHTPKITVTHCAYPAVRIAVEICRNRFVWSWLDRFRFSTHRPRNSRAAWRQHGTLHDKNPYLVRTGRWRPISLFLFRDNSSSFRVWQETRPRYSPSRWHCQERPPDIAYHFSCLAT